METKTRPPAPSAVVPLCDLLAVLRHRWPDCRLAFEATHGRGNLRPATARADRGNLRSRVFCRGCAKGVVMADRASSLERAAIDVQQLLLSAGR